MENLFDVMANAFKWNHIDDSSIFHLGRRSAAKIRANENLLFLFSLPLLVVIVTMRSYSSFSSFYRFPNNIMIVTEHNSNGTLKMALNDFSFFCSSCVNLALTNFRWNSMMNIVKSTYFVCDEQNVVFFWLVIDFALSFMCVCAWFRQN